MDAFNQPVKGALHLSVLAMLEGHVTDTLITHKLYLNAASRMIT